MRIHFLGATRTTTGSMFLLEINDKKLLLECGLFQGRRDESIERNRHFHFDPKTIDAVVLSHAHIDHCGNLPNLCRQGFEGNIFCTFATRDLASIMLEDSAHIQESDAEYLSRKREKKGAPPVEPLYTATDAEKAIRQFISIGYDRPIQVIDGVTVTFRDAGHILGSAQVVFDIKEGERKFRYLFSGDVGRGNDEILRDPHRVENVDYLQVESTYGAREHVSPQRADEEVAKLVRETVERNGKIIIPAFSVGRTQAMVYTLHRLIESKQLAPLPIFVDSPLSVNATEVFRLHPECFNESIYEFLRTKANPFGMEHITYIREVSHSMKLNELKEPAVIISASGMAEAGRIRHHLKNNLGDSRNLILFIGFCAEHTLGAQIKSGKPIVNIFGEPNPVRARIASLDSFSGHADKSELEDYVKGISGKMEKIFVVHGEESQALAFGETLKRLKPGAKVLVPEYQQIVEV